MSDNPYDSTQAKPPSASYSQTPPPNNTLALASMILGIIGILGAIFSCCCGIFAAVPGCLLGIAAVATGGIALSKIKAGTAEGKQMAWAGVICGAVSILLGIVMVALVFAAVGTSMLEEMRQQFKP